MNDILKIFEGLGMECGEEHFRTMAVAYIDVLGTKSLTTFEEQNRISKIFHTAIDEEEKRGNPKKTCKRWSFSFSDCAFIIYTQNKQINRSSVYYDEEDDDDTIPFISLLSNLPLTILQYYQEGFLVRGGISLGNGYVSNNHRRFFGEVFANSSMYDKTGIPPFIFVDEALAQKINSITEKCHTKMIEEQRNKMPEVFAELQKSGLFDYTPYFERLGEYYIFNVFSNYKTHITALETKGYINNANTFFIDFKEKCKYNVEINTNENVKSKWSTMLEYLLSKEEFVNKQLENRIQGSFYQVIN